MAIIYSPPRRRDFLKFLCALCVLGGK
ncbi:MAG: twin-arginine translocation signal domain-containing protein [Anaerolineae bacterium]